MGLPRQRKPTGRIKHSPAQRKRKAANRKREEAGWAARSGPVVTRRVAPTASRPGRPRPSAAAQVWAKGDGPSSIAGRMRKLGYPITAKYADYLASAHWTATKARYRASEHPQACKCGSARVSLHHKTYVRLGAERLTDLEPVCTSCHEALHEIGCVG